MFTPDSSSLSIPFYFQVVVFFHTLIIIFFPAKTSNFIFEIILITVLKKCSLAARWTKHLVKKIDSPYSIFNARSMLKLEGALKYQGSKKNNNNTAILMLGGERFLVHGECENFTPPIISMTVGIIAAAR